MELQDKSSLHDAFRAPPSPGSSEERHAMPTPVLGGFTHTTASGARNTVHEILIRSTCSLGPQRHDETTVYSVQRLCCYLSDHGCVLKTCELSVFLRSTGKCCLETFYVQRGCHVSQLHRLMCRFSLRSTSNGGAQLCTTPGAV